MADGFRLPKFNLWNSEAHGRQGRGEKGTGDSGLGLRFLGFGVYVLGGNKELIIF